MKTLIFISLFLFSMFTAQAQYQLTGTVKEAAGGNAPVAYATVAVLRTDSTAVTGAMTGEDGKFAIAGVAAGDYIVQVSFIGYEKAYRRVNVPAQSDLGEISLAESATRLNEVVVNANRPLIQNHADRYVVNVSGNIQSAGRDALDVLRNTPGLMVDHKGSISLMGNGVQVWIDGRPSRMSGEQLQAFLNSMQGGEIDRIEIVTNPSSRYDAEGGGGIIDIRTKKGLQYGVNGTVTLGYKQGHRDYENAGVNLNWRREKFNMFGNYSVNRTNNWSAPILTNIMQTSEGEITLVNHSEANPATAGWRNSVRAGMDYFINPKHIAGVIVNAYHADKGRPEMKGRTDMTPAFGGVSYTEADHFQKGSSNGVQVNANYQATFARPGQQLNFDLDYARFGSDPLQQNKNIYYAPNDVEIRTEEFRNMNPQVINVYSAKADYKQPLWKDAGMEAGAKFSQTETDNDIRYENFTGGAWVTDAGQSNRFVYTEQIDAAYINLSQKLGKFSLQAGLRGEYTLSEGVQKTTDAANDTAYFNLFPTAFVNYRASEKHNFGVSYSRRLSRPGYSMLNPFEVALDAYSYQVGNPNLMPAYTHNIQFSYSFGQSLMARIAYSDTKDMFVQSPVYDAATERSALTFINFGRSRNAYAMANYRRQIVKIWTANLTVQGGFLHSTSNEASGEFVNESGMFYAQLNNTVTITPTLSADITGWYQSRGRQAYYEMEPMGNFSIGLRQQLLKNKMTLSLTVNDIFNTTKQKAHAKYEDVDYTLVMRHDNQRYVNLTLRYNFGSTTVRAARNKSTGIEDEAGRAG